MHAVIAMGIALCSIVVRGAGFPRPRSASAPVLVANIF
jgi:hypothetical protein